MGRHKMADTATGWITEFESGGSWASNALVFPDEESANAYGFNLLMRWTGASDFRAVPTDEAPNRPSIKDGLDHRGRAI